MTSMPGLDPYTPVILGWVGHGDPTPCGYCDDGQTPSHRVVRISDRLDRDACPDCAHSADPAMAKLAAGLEATWQQLLAHSEHAMHLYTAGDVLRGMADELDVLNTGDRQVHEESTISRHAVTSIYVTRPRDVEPR